MRMMVWAVASALLLVLPATAATANSATIEVTARLQHHNYAALSPVGRGGDAESSRWIVYDRHNRSVGDARGGGHGYRGGRFRHVAG